MAVAAYMKYNFLKLTKKIKKRIKFEQAFECFNVIW